MLGHKKGRNDKKLGGAHRCHPLGPAKWHFTVGKRYVFTTMTNSDKQALIYNSERVFFTELGPFCKSLVQLSVLDSWGMGSFWKSCV